MKPLMKCGHAANAINTQTRQPWCTRWQGNPDADEVEKNSPDLTNRKSRCCYYGKLSGRSGKCSPIMGAFGHPELSAKPNTICQAEISSNLELPFFEHKPEKEYDIFYCGCHGWE
jgi:hypothetical protein